MEPHSVTKLSTQGAALPADISPPSAPGTPDHPAGSGRDDSQPEGSQPEGRLPEGRLPGLPRLFFADDPAAPADPAGPDQPFAGPGQAPPAGPGQPFAGPGHAPPAGPGQAPPAGYRPQGEQPPGWPSGPPRPPQPPQRPARQRPSKPPGRELRQRALASLVLSVLAVIALFGIGSDLRRGVYALIFSAVIGIGACAIGITAVVRARRTGTYRPGGAAGGIVLGALAGLVALLVLASYLAFPAPMTAYVRCLSQAQNSGQQRACANQFYKSVHLGLAGPEPAQGHGRRVAGNRLVPVMAGPLDRPTGRDDLRRAVPRPIGPGR